MLRSFKITMILALIPHRTFSVGSKLRMPSIRFRYGASRDQKPAAAPARTAAAAAPSPADAVAPGVIYDFQIPQRWRRRPISDEEIAYINRGGPE